MKKFMCVLLATLLFAGTISEAFAAPSTLMAAAATQQKIVYSKNARTITYAFVFDGPSEKNAKVLGQFQRAIQISTAPEYKAAFPNDLMFRGNWSKDTVSAACENALKSRATMVVALGYLSTKYMNQRQGKNKFVVTIDQYGLKDLGDGFFNPVQQSIKGALMFKRLVEFKKTAIIMNESFYKTKADWNSYLKPKLTGIDFVVVPISHHHMDEALAKINGCDAVIITPLFNMTENERKILFGKLAEKKIPTFSTLGKEDVVNGVLLGTSSYDLDRKIAEATSFSIKGVLAGQKQKPTPVRFYEDEIVFINKDTADLIGYKPHLRVMNNAEIITNKKPQVYDLSTVFKMMEDNNLDIERKKLLVKAARRESLGAVLRWLPTFSFTMGYQQYNEDYAKTTALQLPESTGIFNLGLEEVIFSPALVTNILVKRRMVDFAKSEEFMTEQNMGINIALMYADTLIMKNLIAVQQDYVKESRENLAIARVREKMGYCGQEEAMRWAAQLNLNEKNLLQMRAELKNLKIGINKILFKNQPEDFELAPLKASDPAFYTSEINIIDYLSTEENVEKFTELLVEEAFKTAPELAKLRAAIKAKNYEMAMYYEKFILPDAKLNLDYQMLADRKWGGPNSIPVPYPLSTMLPNGVTMQRPGADNLRLGIFAQWKPIEGGTKIAKIAQIRAEREELYRYQDEVKTELEKHIRETINRAIADYFSIERDYKSMYASGENYKAVKRQYLKGKVGIAQIIDAENVYLEAKANAMNTQYKFFKELLWVQRGICAVNWASASPEAKAFIQRIKDNIEKKSDLQLL